MELGENSSFGVEKLRGFIRTTKTKHIRNTKTNRKEINRQPSLQILHPIHLFEMEGTKVALSAYVVEG